MNQSHQTRRHFLQRTATGGMACFAVSSALKSRSVLGANDRIRIGMIGCGGRNRWHMGWIQRSSSVVPAEIIAVCDIWEKHLQTGAQEVQKRFQNEPLTYKYYHDLLDNKDIDAVVIATPDHQHCTQLIDAVQAGKDVYVEKPIATTMKDLNKAYKIVQASKQVVQNGTQGRSSKGAAAAKQFIQSGKLGNVLRIEQSRSHYIPYWNHYQSPQTEKETDWNAFLMKAPKRPFDGDRHGHWMGYKEYSPNTIGGWMSHMSDFIHYLTDCGFPISSVSHGGIYSPTSEKQRTCPDTVTAILDYKEGFSTLFTTHFGNAANDYMLIFGTRGTMRVNDPDGNTGGINPRVSGEGSEHPQKLGEEVVALEEIPQDDHMVNWLKCIKSRKLPNAHMGNGYKQGVAVLLAEQARVAERKMVFDESKKRILPA